MDIKELEAIDDWATGKTDEQPSAQIMRALVLEALPELHQAKLDVSDMKRRLESMPTPFDWKPDDYKGMLEVSIRLNDISTYLLTQDQRIILSERLELVQRIALRMALNMVKGILKYANEPGEVKTDAYWLRHAFDDASDNVNYIAILAEQMGVSLDS